MYNILVCDDEKEITDAVEIYLTQEGYQVFKAYDGNQAIELLKKEQIHLLIIDLMMPGMDGIHAVLQIRKDSGIPIIILSAKSQDADKILGLNLGADDYRPWGQSRRRRKTPTSTVPADLPSMTTKRKSRSTGRVCG